MTNQDTMTDTRVNVALTGPTHAVLTQAGHDDDPLEVTSPVHLRAALIARLQQLATTQRRVLTAEIHHQDTGERETLTVDPVHGITTRDRTAPATTKATTSSPATGSNAPGSTRARVTKPTGILNVISAASTGTKVLTAVGLVLLLGLIWAISVLAGGGKPDAAASNGAAPAAAAHGSSTMPDGCLGGTDVLAGARAAAPLAATSTITQNGVVVPSPASAAAAAAAYARLRSTLPVPAGRDQVIAAILAPGAGPSARQGIPDAPGWTTHLDMTKARWLITSGDGRSAGVDLLLTSVGTHNGTTAAPAQLAVHLDLTVVDGQWRLAAVGTPKNTTTLANAHTYANTEVCS